MAKPLEVNGLRPTTRHGVILGVYLGVALLVNSVVVTTHRAIDGTYVLPLVFMFCLWLFGLTIVLLDRPGPVRNWAGPFIVSLSCPYVAVWFDLESALRWVLFSTPPPWYHLVLINAILVGGFAFYCARIYPRRCPSCGLRSLIPLLRLTRPEKRLSRTRWCASCGETLWTDADGQWQKERRRTWVDKPGRVEGDCAGCAH